MDKISVIIPTKNEPFINELVEKINKTLSGIKHEIIIVDKSSTPPKIDNAKILIQKSDGLGNAIIEGLKHSTGDVIVTMDGDGSHRPENLPKLVEKAKNFDIVIGSKYVPGGKTEDKWYRIIISKIYCSFASFVLGLSVKDNMSGFSVVRKYVYKKIKPNPRGFKINMELLYKAKRFGYTATEVPIKFLLPKKKGRPRNIFYEILVNPGFKEAFRTMRFIFELRLGLR